MPATPSAALAGPSDQPWKRWVDENIDALKREADRRKTDGIATDKGLSASLEGLSRALVAIREQQERLSDQQAILAGQQELLASQQALLITQQNALAAQIAFLQGASTSDSRSTILSAPRGASSGISLDGYNSTYDCEISLTTSSTGKLRVSVGGQLTGSDGISALVGYEVLLGGSVIVGVDWERSAAAGGGLATTSRESLIGIPANSSVIVRTRRGWTGGAAGVCVWGYQSLIVTKEGS